MAASDLTGAHYRAQLAIKAEAVRTSQRLWSTWDGEMGTWARLLDLATPLLKHQHALSGQTARAYYAQLIAREIGKHEKALPVPELAADHVAVSLTATGLVGTYVAKSRGFSEQAARQVGFVKFSGSYSRLALSGSRDVLVATVEKSPHATGWDRVLSGDPCQWCEDQADEHDAFGAHDHCSCSVEPRFR